jgi:hypothetical protein
MFKCNGQIARVSNDLKICIATLAIGKILQEEGEMCRLVFECYLITDGTILQ